MTDFLVLVAPMWVIFTLAAQGTVLSGRTGVFNVTQEGVMALGASVGEGVGVPPPAAMGAACVVAGAVGAGDGIENAPLNHRRKSSTANTATPATMPATSSQPRPLCSRERRTPLRRAVW